MKTIGEVIKHAEYIVNNRKDAISVCWSVKDCQQIATWLRELKERRKEPKIIRCCECEHSRDWGCELYCTKWVRYTSHNGYCHRGAERRIDDLQHKTKQD